MPSNLFAFSMFLHNCCHLCKYFEVYFSVTYSQWIWGKRRLKVPSKISTSSKFSLIKWSRSWLSLELVKKNSYYFSDRGFSKDPLESLCTKTQEMLMNHAKKCRNVAVGDYQRERTVFAHICGRIQVSHQPSTWGKKKVISIHLFKLIS